jgi:hypothetical protein
VPWYISLWVLTKNHTWVIIVYETLLNKIIQSTQKWKNTKIVIMIKEQYSDKNCILLKYYNVVIYLLSIWIIVYIVDAYLFLNTWNGSPITVLICCAAMICNQVRNCSVRLFEVWLCYLADIYCGLYISSSGSVVHPACIILLESSLGTSFSHEG